MEKQRIQCSKQNNFSNCPLQLGLGLFVTPHTMSEKKLCNSENRIICLLNNTYSLSTGPTVLISYITVMFYKITSFETTYCWKIDNVVILGNTIWCVSHHSALVIESDLMRKTDAIKPNQKGLRCLRSMGKIQNGATVTRRDRQCYLLVNGTVTSLPVFIENILNCAPKTNEAFMELERQYNHKIINNQQSQHFYFGAE